MSAVWSSSRHKEAQYQVGQKFAIMKHFIYALYGEKTSGLFVPHKGDTL